MAIEWEGWVTLVVMVVGLVVMATDRVGPDMVFLAMIGILLTAQIITLSEGLAGFSNSGLLTVMILFPVAEGVARTGGLDRLFDWLLGKPSTLVVAQIRMMIPVAFLSAFVNNTPIVAILIPLIFQWANSAPDIHPQKLLIPLSFASILGGTCTLIGTSTNLVIAGLLEEEAKTDPSIPVFGMFDITPYGFPYLIIGAIYILVASPALLPPRKKAKGAVPEQPEELLLALKVSSSSPVVGKTIQDAGLRSLDSLFLVGVERAGYTIAAVGPDLQLRTDDILYFSGDFKNFRTLTETFGLYPISDEDEEAAVEFLPATFGSPNLQHCSITLNEGARYRQTASPPHGPVPSAAEAASLPAMPRTRSTPLDATSVQNFQGFPSPKRVNTCMSSMPPGLQLGQNVVDPLPPRTAQASPRTPMSPMSSRTSELTRVQLRPESSLVGHSIRQVGFRRRFQAAVVAVIRNGSRVSGKMGDIVLAAKDTLVLNVSSRFSQHDRDVIENFEQLQTVTEAPGGHEFMAPMVVLPDGEICGKTIQDAGLRGLPGLFLVSIDRSSGETLNAVDPSVVLQPDDVLWFSGDTEAIGDLRKITGLEHQEMKQVNKVGVEHIHRKIVQAVVASGSSLVGRSVKRVAFRTNYDAAIVAVHRQGEKISSKIGDIYLKAGDVLLLYTNADFVNKYRQDRAFALVAEVEKAAPPQNTSKMWFAVAFALAMVSTQVIGAFIPSGQFIDLFTAALLAAAGMLMTGCLTVKQARRSVNWDIFVTIGAAFAVSTAMDKTGVADAIATLLVAAGQAVGGKISVQAAIYLATALLSNLIANNAAAAIMFPIAFQVAKQLGINQTEMAVTLMLGASSCYFTPFGYQTNLMVFGAGGYRTLDFVFFGLPMQLWLACGYTLVIATVDYNVWMNVAAAVVMLLLVAYPFVQPLIARCFKRSGESHPSNDLHRGLEPGVSETSVWNQV